jgi:hypothetical protein
MIRRRAARPTQVVVAVAILACTVVVAPTSMAAPRATWIGIYPRLYEPGVDARYYRHPHGFRLDSSDQDIRFVDLRWRRWGGRSALGVGRARACGEGNESEPYSCESRRVRLIAGDRGSCPTGGYLYQHLVVIHAPRMYGGRFEILVAPQRCGPP